MTQRTIPQRGKMLRTEDVAELLDIEVRTLERWRRDGSGPPYMSFGRTIRYQPARLAEWVARHEKGHPSSKRGAPSNDKGGTSQNRGTPSSKRGARGR